MAALSIESILAAGVKIPPCPQVLIDLRPILQDSDSDDRIIARLIERDIKLTAAVFKMVNSAAISVGKKKLDTVDQAIAMVGRRALGNIVNASALLLACSGPDRRLVRFWERYLDIAMLCSIVADKAPKSSPLSPEQHFTSGLFHDCGVALLIQHFPNYCKGFGIRTAALPDISAEDDVHKTCHCMVGQMIAKEWELPEFVCETIRCHHLSLENAPPVASMSLAALHMSLHIANANSKTDDSAWAAQRDNTIAVLGLSADTVGKFESDVLSSFEILH